MEQDCKWEGTVGTLDKHLAECEFALVPCPKECKDDSGKVKHFIKKQVKKHLRRACPNRDYTCKHCGEKGTYAAITRVHDEVCDMKLLPCPNECGATIPRKNIGKHVQNECEYTVIPCKFQNIGCKIEMKREKMAPHEDDDKLHLHMALNAVVKLQNANTELSTKLEENCLTLKEGGTITFALRDYQNKKKMWVTSPSFYTHPNGYHMALRLLANGNGDAEGTHVSVYGLILEGKFDKGLKWPFAGEVTVTLLNQLEDKNHYTLTFALRDACVGKPLGIKKCFPHSALAHDPVKNTQYLKDDTLYFRVSVEVSDHKPWLECSTN